MSEIKVNKLSPRSGTTVTIGDSGDTVNIVGTLQNNGSAIPGDISSVVAGTNLSGGGTSGDVTLNLADASTSAKGAASFSSDNFAASSGAVTIKDAGIATAEIQDNAVTTAKITDSNVTEAKVADNAITLAKMASGTDGNIISYDASGNPVAIATGSDGQVLTSAGAGAQPAFETLASEANTPAFQVLLSSSQSVNSGTNTIIAFDTEIFDSDNAVSSGVFTVPSGKAGKYFFAVNGGMNTGNNIEYVNLWISKNGQTTIATTSGWAIAIEYYHQGDAGSSNQIQSVSGTMDLAVGDSVKIYILHNFGSSKGTADKGRFTFSGHRLIT